MTHGTPTTQSVLRVPRPGPRARLLALLLLLPFASNAEEPEGLTPKAFSAVHGCVLADAQKSERFDGVDSKDAVFYSCSKNPFGYPAILTGQFVGGHLAALRYSFEKKGPGWEPSRLADPAREGVASLTAQLGKGEESVSLTTRTTRWPGGVELRFTPSGGFSRLEVLSIPLPGEQPILPLWVQPDNPHGERGPLSWQRVVEVPGSPDDLYTRARLWFAESFVDSDSVLEIEDKGERLLLGKGRVQFANTAVLLGSGGLDGFVRFTIRVETKDQRYRVTISNLVHEPSSGLSIGQLRHGRMPSQTPGGYAETWYADVHADMKRQAGVQIDALLGSLLLRMGRDSHAEDEW